MHQSRVSSLLGKKNTAVTSLSSLKMILNQKSAIVAWGWRKKLVACLDLSWSGSTRMLCDLTVGVGQASAMTWFGLSALKGSCCLCFIEKLAASAGSASWFQTVVSAERRRRQLTIRSASALRRDGWGCHAPSPCRCNWGFSCCDTTRFVFPRGGGLKKKAWQDGSLIVRRHADKHIYLMHLQFSLSWIRVMNRCHLSSVL